MAFVLHLLLAEGSTSCGHQRRRGDSRPVIAPLVSYLPQIVLPSPSARGPQCTRSDCDSCDPLLASNAAAVTVSW